MARQEKSTDFTVKFGGKLNEVNVNTLLRSLASISTVIDEVSNEIGEGQKLEVKIKALDRGSFLIHIGLIPAEIVDLVKQVDLKLASEVIAALVGILTIRKLLKGKKPKKVEEQKDNVIVETESGNRFKVDKRTFNIYNSNVRINEAVSDNFDALHANSSIEGFSIEDPNKEVLFESSRDEFDIMSAKGVTEIPEENVKILTQPVTLHIRKLVWDKARKWDFLLRGIKISAFIRDDAFFHQIDKGEKFAKGDCLEVELEIRQIFDESINTFVNDSYTIAKVLKHIPRPPQESLDI